MTLKEGLCEVIDSLKTLNVQGFDSMNTLVGCVITLESMIKFLDTTEAEYVKSNR